MATSAKHAGHVVKARPDKAGGGAAVVLLDVMHALFIAHLTFADEHKLFRCHSRELCCPVVTHHF